MREIHQDLRFALRRLRQHPGFAAVVVMTLAIGLGANTTVFTLVHALILRALPVERPDELYRLGDGTDCCVNSGLPGNNSFSLFSFRLFEHLKANAPGFTELAAFQATTAPFGVRRAGQRVATTLPGSFVTANYFTMFDVSAAAGRVLTADDDRPGAAPVAVISHAAWTRYFGQDPAVVGGDVIVSGQPFTIVGVSAEPFFGDTIRPDPAAIWIPIVQEPRVRGEASIVERPNQHWLYAIGRIRPDVDAAQISERATAALQHWLISQPEERQREEILRQRITVTPAGGGVALARAQYAQSLTVLFAASAMVLLIAIANLANLLLARADRGQAAIRVALGASSGRLIQQSTVEGVLLSVIGGAVGIGFAALGTRLLMAWVFPIVNYVPIDSTPSLLVWLFAIGLSVFAGVLFTAGPAWMISRTPPRDALSSVGRSVSTRSFLPRASLLIVQVALSMALLASASLIAKNLRNLENQPLGFVPNDRTVFHIDPPAVAGQIDRLTALFARIEEGVRRLPGVERVAYAMYSPMDGNNWSGLISIAGRHSDPDQPDFSSWNRVSTTFFETVGTRVLLGRTFDERDTPGGKHVAVINQSFAQRFFENERPIGRSVGIGDAAHAGDYEIVGVVDDVKFSGARQREVRPMIFLPAFQTVEYAELTQRNVQARSTLPRTLIVQTAAKAQSVEGGVRRVLADADPNFNVLRVLPMTLQVNANFRIERLLARLISIYGVLALGLALLGLYGVTAYGVSQRQREIGLRMALGADRWGVVRTCLRGPLTHTATGLVIGLGAAIAIGRAIRSQLYGTEGLDPASLGIAIAALLGSAIIAALVPARRAASVNPLTVLRGE